MGFLQAVNIEDNFWILNPEIKFITPFDKIYKEDEDKKKHFSSKLMWAIYLYSDPDSRFARMDTEEKRSEILNNYMDESIPDNFWDTREIKELILAYEDRILTKLQKSYNRLLKKLEERDAFISKTQYNEKNAKMLDTMFANSSEIYQQLVEIGAELQTEKKAGNIKGGRKESLSERGII